MTELWTPPGPEEELRAHLEASIAERGFPLHPDLRPILDGDLDPTARAWRNRAGEETSAMLRSLEGALAYYTIEGLIHSLTPLGQMAVAFALLQTLSGDHGDVPQETLDEADRAGMSVEEMLDVFGELRPVQTLVVGPDPADSSGVTPVTVQEELRRALWHLERAYLAVKPDQEENRNGD